MIDLLGFWVAITVLYLPGFILLYEFSLVAICIYLGHISDGEIKKENVFKFSLCDRVSLPPPAWAVGIISGVSVPLFTYLTTLPPNVDMTYLERAISFGETLSPLFGIVSVFAIFLFLSLKVGKIFYKLYSVVTKIKKKLDHHVNDKEAHND